MKRLLISMLILAIASMAHGAGTGLTYHEIQFVDETGAKVTDISSIQIYNPDSTTNAVIYMDSALTNAITQPILTDSTNTTFSQSNGTVYWWGADGYDYTFTNGTNIARNAGHRTRTGSEGRLYFPSYLADISSATYEDDETIAMGDDADFTLNAGTTADRLTITPTTNGTSSIWLGSTSATCDVNFFGDTATYDMTWDATDNRLEFADNAILSIGTGNDYYITHNGTTTTATGAITHASASIFSTDVTLTGNAYNVEWDNSSDTLHLLDNAELGIGGATTADGDVVFKHDGTTLSMTSIRIDEPWTIGGTTYGFDTTYYFETSGTIDMDYDGKNMTFSDNVSAVFGSNDDASIMYDETTDDNLEILAGSVGMSITTNDFLATLDGAAADQFKVDATGIVVGDAINLETTDGGIMLNADGAENGDIELNSADDMIITSAGAMTVTVTGNLAYAVTGTTIFTNEISSTAGVQSGAVTVTATADGLTTGLIPSGTRFVTVTSDTATKVVVLPASVIGNIITITVPATGAELQTLDTTNETINGVDCDGTNEMAMAAGSVYTLTCTKAITWVAHGWDSAGAAQATIVPDAD